MNVVMVLMNVMIVVVMVVTRGNGGCVDGEGLWVLSSRFSRGGERIV